MATTNMNTAIQSVEDALKQLPATRNGTDVTTTTKNLIQLIKQYRSEQQNEKAKLMDRIKDLEQQIGHYQREDNKLSEISNKLDALAKDAKETSTKISYNDAVKKPARKQQPKAVLISSKDRNMTANDIKKTICNSIDSTGMNCTYIRVNRSNVAFTFECGASRKRFIDEVRSNQYTTQLETHTPAPKCPTIMIRNIEYTTLEKDLIATIIRTNGSLKDKEKNIKILYTIKRRYNYDAVLCISPHIYEIIMGLGSLVTGWTMSEVNETFLINSCGNCLSFEHRTKGCPNRQQKTCRNCCRSFSTTSDDPSDRTKNEFREHIRHCRTIECNKCLNHPVHGSSTQHLANTSECPIYKQKEQQIYEITCYDRNEEVTFETRNPVIDLGNRTESLASSALTSMSTPNSA